ncbi:MAG: calcium-binding protein [Actinomycetota bacterium]
MLKRLLGLLLCAGLLAPLTSSASPVRTQFVCFGEATKLWKPDRRGVVRGSERADVIVVKERDVVVLGRGGNDRICTVRKAYVAGGAGHDSISTFRGKDRVDGGPGRDYLNGGPDSDRLYGGYGASDTLVGGAGDDLLDGGDGESADDFLFGGSGDDDLLGGEGADLLLGGEGADLIDGGSGPSDTVNFVFEDLGVAVDLSRVGEALATGDALYGIENVRGSDLADTITGSVAANALWGGDGDDVIQASSGSDVVDGGAGADALDGGDERDVLSFLDSSAGVTVDLETGATSNGDGLLGFEDIRGSAHDDQLSGDAGANDLSGSRGADQLFGLDGDDTLSSGGGDAGEGNDTCFEVEGEIASCEVPVPVAPMRRSIITSPLQASTVDIEAFTEITGLGFAGQVALRRLSGSGCYWWHARLAHMEAGHCGRAFWNDAKLDDNGSWSKRIPQPAQLLNAGHYEVWSRIVTRDFTEREFQAPYNLVQFRLR